MAKARTSKIWPNRILEQSDVLITGVRARAHLNACIGPQLPDQSAMDWYSEGFRSAARRLVDELVTDGQTAAFPIDTVVYPIVFLYRHHFELFLKLLIRDCKLAQGEIGSFPKGHKLTPLWQEFRTLAEKLFPKADWSQNSTAEALFKELDAVDPIGQAARYPQSTAGDKSFHDKPLLNVEHFANTADRLSKYLEAIAYGVDYLRSN